MDKFPSIDEFKRLRTDERAALRFVFDWRFGSQPCTGCGKITFYKQICDRPRFKCEYCKHEISALKGTVLEKSNVPVNVWIEFLMFFSFSGGKAQTFEIEYATGIKQPTAWEMSMRLRYLMHTETEKMGKIGGVKWVETDEWTYGAETTMAESIEAIGKKDSLWNKCWFIGGIERDGRVIIRWIPFEKSMPDVERFFTKYIQPRTKVFTDKYSGYDNLTKLGYEHRKISDRGGGHHTNTMECVWGHLERFLKTHLWIGEKYLQLYISEFCFRHNRKRNTHTVFYDLLKLVLTTDKREINIEAEPVPDFRRGKRSFDE